MKFIGYTKMTDGNYKKVCVFEQGASKRVEVIIRDRDSKLIRVLRGKEVRGFE